MSTGLLRPLVAGEGPATVAVDFGGGRVEAEFSDLFADLRGVGPVVELAPLSLAPRREASARCDTYVDAYAEALVGLGPPACVTGYCVASPIAHELAVRLAAEGRAPRRLVLFDAAPVSAAEVRAAYEKVSRSTPGDPAALEDLARGVAAGGDAALLDDVRSELVEQLRSECAAAGIPRESPIARELVARQAAWFSYVVAACSAPLTHYEGEVALICSKEQVTPGEWPARSVQRFDVDASQPDLLAVEPVRELISELLREASR